MLDLRNKDGSLTGETKERSLVHRDGDLHGTVHIWLVRYRPEDQTAEVLLQKRSAGKDSYPGFYDISSAGHIPAGGDFLESALRELKEELGISAQAAELYHVFDYVGYSQAEFHGSMFKNYEYSRDYIMECSLEPEDMELQADEVESVMWMEYRRALDGIKHGTIKSCIIQDEFMELTLHMERYFAESGRPLAPAVTTDTWAQDAQLDLEDWIEEQGIYLRQ